MSGQRHPDAEALASFQEGLVNGFRGRRLAAHVAGCARCASVTDQLSEVSSALAAVPGPSLPAAFESQLMAALAAEAAARTSDGTVHAAAPATATEPAPEPGPEPGPARARRRSRPARVWRLRYGLRIRLAYAVPVAATLLAGFGYLASQLAGTAAVPSTAASAASSAYASTVPRAQPAAPSPGPLSAETSAGHVPFLVTTSGISYQQGTLREQVGDQLALYRSALAVTPAPSISASASPPAGGSNGQNGTTTGAAGQSTGAVPTKTLVACVFHLTDGAVPSLVDRAAYQGTPVYVIAVPDRAWVVGLGCTASKPDVITTVSLDAAG
jgi:hypothetical protein